MIKNVLAIGPGEHYSYHFNDTLIDGQQVGLRQKVLSHLMEKIK